MYTSEDFFKENYRVYSYREELGNIVEEFLYGEIVQI